MSTFKVGDRVRWTRGGNKWQSITLTTAPINDAALWLGMDDELGLGGFNERDLEHIATPTPETRALNLIRRIAAHGGEWGIEARAIVKDVEQDGDLIEARAIAVHHALPGREGVSTYAVSRGEADNLDCVKAIIAAIRRGRALERGEG